MWAQKAWDEFSSSFDAKFSYMKSGQHHVKTKAGDIAKQYYLLKNICDDDNDDEGEEEEEVSWGLVVYCHSLILYFT